MAADANRGGAGGGDQRMTGLLLLAPLLMAFLPGLWSFGHMKRMFWTMMVFLFLPVLLMIPGGMLLEVFGMTWRCAAVRWCGLLFFAGIAVCFLWAAAYLWREVPGDRPLYADYAPAEVRPVELRLIPYFAWANRGEGEMRVWLRVR